MKLKLRYFIRGLGVGIVFTAIVMSLSLQASRSRIIRESALTKDEIMEKAMGYGMIMDSSHSIIKEDNELSQEEQKEEESQNIEDGQNIEDNQNADNQRVEEFNSDSQREDENKENDNSNSEKDIVESNEDSSKDKKASKDKESSNEETNEKDTIDEVTEDESLKENSDKDDKVVSIDYIPIKITSGMTATSVGNLLKEKKIIEDSDEFRIYMSEQGYSSKIRTGEYLIPVAATYKKIAEIITRKR